MLWRRIISRSFDRQFVYLKVSDLHYQSKILWHNFYQLSLIWLQPDHSFTTLNFFASQTYIDTGTEINLEIMMCVRHIMKHNQRCFLFVEGYHFEVMFVKYVFFAFIVE